MSIVRVPITNAYAGGDYTARIAIGSEKTIANVILDTGSSTLAVSPSVYNPDTDTAVKKTALAQDVIYGTGGWTGPVVKTAVSVGSDGKQASVDSYIAIADDEEARSFAGADGILGLAYNVLNEAYDLEAYLEERKVDPPSTSPWPLRVSGSRAALEQLMTFLRRMPQQDLPPLFTALEEADVQKNVFAFYTLRSVPSMRRADPATDPLNNGFFILGGGEEEHDLFTGEFVSVDVVDDAWYNTELLAVQVGDADEVAIKSLPRQYAKTMLSNSIVDSGTNSLVLSDEVFNAIASSLQTLDPSFVQKIEKAMREGIAADELELGGWPDIKFTLRGDQDERVTLTCAPHTYWQVDAPNSGEAIFMISGSQLPQSIFGLPLMNNYYTVFDRAQDPYGVIRFAPIVVPAGVA